MNLANWAVHPDFPNYTVWRDGFVCDGDWIKGELRSGYLRVRLVDRASKRRWVPVHKLVLEVFKGPRPSAKHHGAHLDGDKSNNRIENLEWKLPAENEADKKLVGTAPKGCTKRLTELQARAIKALLNNGWSYSSIAKVVGVHRLTVSRIDKGERWREVAA